MYDYLGLLGYFFTQTLTLNRCVLLQVVVEQLIGVTANVLGDMASRPNWGLNELDFVFATLVVRWRRLARETRGETMG